MAVGRERQHASVSNGRWQRSFSGRPTIGFLTGNINAGAARALWPGVLDATAAADVNLISFPGGRLQAIDNFEAQRNILYDLIDPLQLDGLVSWATSLVGAPDPYEAADFQRRFNDLPVVGLASSAAGEPSISIDSYQGMRSAVAHLVRDHGYRKLAMLRGPEGHHYAQERFRAFRDALIEEDIPHDPKLISPPSNWEKGAEAMAYLLDAQRLRPGRDFEAIVTASDLLALAAMRTLADRGIRVPNDVAIVGFNALPESQLTRPPLSSVALPFYEQGRRAVDTLLAVRAGKPVAQHVTLESQLLVRRSCGCPSRSLALASAAPRATRDQVTGISADEFQASLASHIFSITGNHRQARAWAGQLVVGFSKDLADPERHRFAATLDSILQQRGLDGDEAVAWHTTVARMRQWALPGLDDRELLLAENLFGQARLAISDGAHRAHIARQFQAERRAELLRDIGQALITTFDLDGLADALIDSLPRLGIASCYLALYEDSTAPLEWSRLAAALRDGQRVPLPPTGQRFRSRQLAPPELFPDRRYSMVVEPLFFQAEQIGFVMFEVGPQDGSVYEVLRGHISTALKGALLLSEAYQARIAAEKGDQIKTQLLANVSHELRTPLNIIIGHTQRALNAPATQTTAPSPELARELRHIQSSAQHQLRIINDLLDLSRAEINELDLYPSLLDPRPLLEEAFVAMADEDPATGPVCWRLDVPADLPAVEIDPVRMRQVLLNLLNNARRFTERGSIVLGAAAESDELHIWISDTGAGIPPHQREHVFEPFVTGDLTDRQYGGIGLGLSITRHLVALHGGRMALDSEPGKGSTFHVFLPQAATEADGRQVNRTLLPVLWLVAGGQTTPPEIEEYCHQRALEIVRLPADQNMTFLLKDGVPAAVAWDLENSSTQRWSMMRRIYNHPLLSGTPFLLYQRAAGLTSLSVKQASPDALWDAVESAMPREADDSVLIVDDDPQARRLAREVIARGLPDLIIHEAADGAAAIEALGAIKPNLVILDLMMPNIDGFEVLDRMRAGEDTRAIPVVILSSRQLTLDDVKRLERHAMVTVQSKGMLSEEEMIASLNQALFGSDTLPPQTSALAKQAIAYLQGNHTRRLSRWEIASAVGTSEDYLSRVFHRELGITPWDYLNRYRVIQAKELLRLTDDPVGSIARRVGFTDAAYFSRVFRAISGVSPSQYRATLTG